MEFTKTIKNACEDTKCAAKKMVKTFDFVKGLSIKNKFNFDLQVKSNKSVFPIYKYSTGYNKEWRVMPIILAAMAFFGLMLMFKMPKGKNK